MNNIRTRARIHIFNVQFVCVCVCFWMYSVIRVRVATFVNMISRTQHNGLSCISQNLDSLLHVICMLELVRIEKRLLSSH